MVDTLKNTCSVDLVGLKKLENRCCPLPDDVLAKIISFLPTKAFFKLLPVCKTFRQLSLDSHFLFLQSYYNNTISGFIVHNDNILKSIILIDPYAGVSSSSLEFIVSMKSIILGSAGGLIFVLNQKYERSDATTTGICVYNPARGTRCWLPAPPGECTPGGIAVRFMNDEDGVMKDYKLVYVTQTWGLSISHHCRVYDSVARAWTMDKELDLGHQQLDLEEPVVCGDAVFWLSSDLKSYARIGPYVVTFDVREECTQVIPLPSETVIDFFAIFGIAKWEGKSLCLIHYSSFSGVIGLWPLKKKASDGALEWVKMHEISLAQMGFTGEPCFVNYVKLIEVATTTLLVFITYDSMYSYNMKDGGALEWQDCWGFPYSHKFIPYSNTLRPCGDREELLETI